MNVLRRTIGGLLIVAAFGAVAYGLYFDIVHLFVGGIVEVVDGVKADPAIGSKIGWGIFRICISGVGLVVGIVVAMFLGGSGVALMGGESRRSRRRSLRRR